MRSNGHPDRLPRQTGRARALHSELGGILTDYLTRDPFLPVVEPLPGGNEVIIRARDQRLGGPPAELTLRAGKIAILKHVTEIVDLLTPELL